MNLITQRSLRWLLPPTVFFMTSIFGVAAVADGMVVDKVYHPYVLPYQRRVEWRLASHDTSKGNLLNERLGFGQSISEYATTEFYFIGQRDENSDFNISAYELESRWMITDQGEYWADWGLLFELEKQRSNDNYEASAGVLMEKEFGRTSLTLNGFLIYEWGAQLKNEMESEFRMQYRYRWKPEFQPSIELYTGQRFIGLGPGFMGIKRFDGQKQLKWEMGFIAELREDGKNNTLRMALDYEY